MMDKAWVHWQRNEVEYRKAAENFVELAKTRTGEKKLRCPCKVCQNFRRGDDNKVVEHLVINGMDMTYTTWFWHGEPLDAVQSGIETTETHELCEAAFEHDDAFEPGITEERMGAEFEEFFENAELPLYPGCTKYTKLAATVVLYKLKVTHGVSDSFFDGLLRVLQDMLPAGNTIPDSSYLADSLIKEFQLEEKKIHACVNDCYLFRDEKIDECPKCNSSRWFVDEKTNEIKKGVPAKVLRYFPIIPRFKRMFQLPKMAEHLRWHHNNKSTDGNMRHPVDSEAWQEVDKKWPLFSAEPRNLRLGLAADGVNPFSNLSSTHSCWPVMLCTYNLPPWLCMRKEHLMLALLIPGKKQPGNEIDVYLQPLIDDLMELWNKGVEVYDAFTKTIFNLKAVLMWTVNDFPALGNLAGCTTKGKTACPTCGVNTNSMWLPFSGKTVYMDHRCFLPPNHSFRKKRRWFNGKHEYREKPKVMSGSEIKVVVDKIENDFGKDENKTKKRKREEHVLMWKKRSIFFDLPYWEYNPLRHNVDVMHQEKNVCESIIATLFNVKNKSKDHLKSRQDLQQLGIRHELHPEVRGNRTYLPPAPHTLSKVEKRIFCKRLQDLKLPYGYSSNIGRVISGDEFKILGLKSHDFHVLMQQLLSVALRGLLPKGPRTAIFHLCAFYNELCKKVVNTERLKKLERDVAETLCMLERFFPPSFFDIMIHLTIHLAREARLGGPVHLRWMYAFERYMKELKGYVRNFARPEGSIAKCYLAEEGMRFCSEFMKQTVEISTRRSKNDSFASDAILDGRPNSRGVSIRLSKERLHAAHLYVLFNTAVVEPYFEKHMDELRKQNKQLSRNRNLLWKRHVEKFSEWLREKIVEDTSENISETLKWIANGPRKLAMSYSSFIVKGQRYHKKSAEKSNQNSGVSLESTTMCRSSSKDRNQVMNNVSYYGVIKDIILLDYIGFQVPVFFCDWANVGNGVKVEDGFTLVNLHQGQRQFEKEPFILASQAKQVFYSRDNSDSNWYVVLQSPPRGRHDLDMYEENVDIFSGPLDVSRIDKNIDDEDGSYVRKDCEGDYV